MVELITFILLVLGALPLLEEALLSFQENAEMPADQFEHIHDMLQLLPSVVITLVIVHVCLHVLVGICLIRHCCFSACYLAGVLTCLHFPLGTVLGIFTIAVLSKQETKQLFGR